MKLVDWIGQSQEHTKEEMVMCAARGECNQCGLCCVAFETVVPLTIPKNIGEPVEVTRTALFKVCPHLNMEDGLSSCQAHEVKAHPTLRDCREWNGPAAFNAADLPGVRNFDMMLHNFWTWVIFLCDRNDLLSANALIKKGFIHWKPNVQVTPEQIEEFIGKLARVDELPVELLELMKFRELILRLSPKKLRILRKQLGLNSQNLSRAQRVLVQNYFPQG